MVALTVGRPVAADVPAAVCAATLTPKLVELLTSPFVSVVTTTVLLVVSAEQAVQVVHCGSVDHLPLVQPGHDGDGHTLPFHHEVHGPEVQGPEVQGPEVHGPP